MFGYVSGGRIMAYTIIPDSDIDPDSPITTGLMTAYRDNITEVAEGASGARIHPSSALDDAITTEGSQSIGASATWTPSQGIYNMMQILASTLGASLSLFESSTWRQDASGKTLNGLQSFDGTNARVYNNNGSSSAVVYWHRLDG